MSERARIQMEERYGPLGSGASELTIQGRRYDLYELLKALGEDFDDIRPIDAAELEPEGRFALRIFDLEERMVVAFEFDAGFRILAENRAHIEEWMGEDYFNFNWGIWCPDSV
ncbi:MAG TPA: hypothetical protein VJM10_00995 [Candidatus Methylomirabilis sp.]|nr:hypothetical protein [Candidatus Methylomirabilis sp.]